jgi:sugar/nucleoside kinase (ribokinase family)
MRVAGILVVGDINTDLLARLDAGIELGGDNLACELLESCGGVGANTALALARWGVPARLLGCVGRDWFGRRVLDLLGAGGVDVSFVQQTDRAPTGLMFIAVTPGGQRTMFGSRGANTCLGGLEAPAGDWECLEGVAAMHLVGHIFLNPVSGGVAERLFEEARKRRVRVSLDVGMAPSREIPEKILYVARNVDILFVGREEAFGLYNKRDLESVLAALRECGAREIGMKLGAEGCLVSDGEGWIEVPAFSVESRDTTGSGDAFAAAYLHARRHGWSHAEAALVANAAGAAAATALGAAGSMPAPEQVLGLLETSRLVPFQLSKTNSVAPSTQSGPCPNAPRDRANQVGTALAAWESLRGQVIERLRSELRRVAGARPPQAGGGQHGATA